MTKVIKENANKIMKKKLNNYNKLVKKTIKIKANANFLFLFIL